MARKSIIVLAVTIVLAAGLLFVLSSPTGISIPGLNLGGSEKTFLKDRTVDFLEDIKFKDFKTASTYHLAEAQKKRDIPDLIRRVFAVKHEVLDIKDYKILGVEMDRSKGRARVRALVYFHVLGTKKVRDSARSRDNVEMLFYWFKQPDGTWAMELESSLR